MKNKTTFTPGPWRIDDSEVSPLILTDSEEHDGAIIAKVFSNAEAGNDEPEEVNAANAALIAAAPDLLAALEFCADLLADPYPTRKRAERLLVLVRAAMAKAKGE